MSHITGVTIVGATLAAGATAYEITAETDTQLSFTFDTEPASACLIRCHLFEPVFEIDYYLPDITLTPPPPPDPANPPVVGGGAVGAAPVPPWNTVTVSFPEDLAGAEIRMTFYLQLNLASLAVSPEYGAATPPAAGAPPDHIGKTIKITSSEAAIPRIESIYFAQDENIRFTPAAPVGSPSSLPVAAALRLTPIHGNEIAFFHIHTRGLYGQMMPVTINLGGEKRYRIKNNIYAGAIPVYAIDPAAIPPAVTHLRIQMRHRNGKVTPGTPAQAINSLPALPAPYGATNPVCIHQTDYPIVDYTQLISLGGHDIPLDLTNTTVIIPTTTAVVAQAGRDIDPPDGSDAQCRLEFRPTMGYNGNFGFSWFRVGDIYPDLQAGVSNSVTGFNGTIYLPSNDQDFNTTMGRHYDSAATSTPRTTGAVLQDGNDGSIHFDIDTQMIENHKTDYRKLLLTNMPTVEYLVPVMTIRPIAPPPPVPPGGAAPAPVPPDPNIARLLVFIEALKPLDRIEFEFDNPSATNDGYFTITPNALPAIPVTTPFQYTTHTVAITCHKEFSKELMLWAKAFPTPTAGAPPVIPDICGAIRLLPNDISHQRNIKVVFFNMETELNIGITHNGFPNTADRNTRINEAEKYLGQAYVNLDISVEPLILATPAPPPPAPGYTCSVGGSCSSRHHR